MPPLNSSSTFNALGIFGRLEPSQEQYFRHIQNKHYLLPEDADEFGVFPHLTVAVAGTKVIDGQDIAFTFDINQTLKIRNIAAEIFPHGAIITDYCIIMRHAPRHTHNQIIRELADIKELSFTDFKLCANRVDESGILYSSLNIG